jgi:glycosyltransferase involved in cell wall biosynthesis
MFTGSMDWEPNIDGVEYFCSEIWPEVLRRVPGARFRIVGRVPHSRVRKLASSSIEVTGTVSSMIEQFREATVLVVPLRAGGGTRIKIYEGMAMGKATVSTSIGAEGLQVHPGRDILLADDPRQFADCVVAVLGDEDVRRRYEAAAAAAVKNFDWSVITDGFIRELQKTIDEVRQEPGQFLCQASPFS